MPVIFAEMITELKSETFIYCNFWEFIVVSFCHFQKRSSHLISPGFCVNSTVQSKARLSFWPVAHRNRHSKLGFFWGNRGSSARPGMEPIAAATSEMEICKKTRKITKIIHDRILYRNFRWDDYKIKFAQNKAAVCNLKSRMVLNSRRQFFWSGIALHDFN